MSASLNTLRIVLWTLVAVAALGATSLFVFNGMRGGNPAASGIGNGDYQLAAADGTPFNRQALNGHPSAVFFGFTHCPEVCPTTLAEMTYWFQQLGDEAKDLKAYFVSVDPERDRPEVIGAYVAWTGHVTGVTGSREETDKAISSWAIYAKKIPMDGGEYNMDHTASVFLMNRDGEFEGTIAYRENSKTAIEKLRRLVGT